MFEIRCIIELFGKPADALLKVLDNIIKSIKEREEVELLKFEHGKPENVKGEFFSAFTEVTVRIRDIEKLIGFLIDFGPVNIEILKPVGEVVIDSNDLESVLNDLMNKIHEFDNRLKVVGSKYAQLEDEYNKLVSQQSRS